MPHTTAILPGGNGEHGPRLARREPEARACDTAPSPAASDQPVHQVTRHRHEPCHSEGRNLAADIHRRRHRGQRRRDHRNRLPRSRLGQRKPANYCPAVHGGYRDRVRIQHVRGVCTRAMRHRTNAAGKVKIGRNHAHRGRPKARQRRDGPGGTPLLQNLTAKMRSAVRGDGPA
jgi:hypothetical protein